MWLTSITLGLHPWFLQGLLILLGFFPPQTSSEEIAHSFLINEAENRHQNEICDLVYKLFDSSEKEGMQLRRAPSLMSVYCQRKFFSELRKYTITADSHWSPTYFLAIIVTILGLLHKQNHPQRDWGGCRDGREGKQG